MNDEDRGPMSALVITAICVVAMILIVALKCAAGP